MKLSKVRQSEVYDNRVGQSVEAFDTALGVLKEYYNVDNKDDLI